MLNAGLGTVGAAGLGAFLSAGLVVGVGEGFAVVVLGAVFVVDGFVSGCFEAELLLGVTLVLGAVVFSEAGLAAGFCVWLEGVGFFSEGLDNGVLAVGVLVGVALPGVVLEGVAFPVFSAVLPGVFVVFAGDLATSGLVSLISSWATTGITTVPLFI